MARFYGEMQGNRGATSRMGEASSGFWGHIRGWHIGAQVRMNAEGDTDVCSVRITEGSASYNSGTALGEFETGPNGVVWSPTLHVVNAILKAHGKRPVDESSTVAL